MRDILVALLSTAVVAALPESAPADPAAAASNGDISPYQTVVNGVEKRSRNQRMKPVRALAAVIRLQ
uniref:Uncharacterized protein n=1 Tax=Pristionchus pacificus TaxID=54126 RepID=A0A2A6BAA6_PRIPA|eukprot:PDM62819.1 hypothetical protein PRIPAC_50034 [Pristionchus pacificus]